MTSAARKQALLEQIALCEGIVKRLKAQDPPPLPLLRAVSDVLGDFESKLEEHEAAARAARDSRD